MVKTFLVLMLQTGWKARSGQSGRTNLSYSLTTRIDTLVFLCLLRRHYHWRCVCVYSFPLGYCVFFCHSLTKFLTNYMPWIIWAVFKIPSWLMMRQDRGFTTQYIGDHHHPLWESSQPTSKIEWQRILNHVTDRDLDVALPKLDSWQPGNREATSDHHHL